MNQCPVWPQVREKMLAEADDSRDRRLDYSEFRALIAELSSGALRRYRRLRAGVRVRFAVCGLRLAGWDIMHP